GVLRPGLSASSQSRRARAHDRGRQPRRHRGLPGDWPHRVELRRRRGRADRLDAGGAALWRGARPARTPAMSGRPWLAAVGLFAALCVVVTVWASIDRHPPEWDYANHLERALECHRTLANPAADRFGEIMGASAFYPPLAICTAGAFYFAFPVTTLTAQAVMLLFLGIAMFSVYGIGRTIADPMAGLLAAFFFRTPPPPAHSLLPFPLHPP